ncbi:hypothetical protein Pres01_20720 [Metapseudomonas resinovorans]|uniref:hypothetical protein n=1 Tax=Metapseudomonas resinovorans TaxID=53412 RepID=UPI00131D07B9|nr:hypothetical protein [Pseudomonas resinovorans]GLZ86021.1 hypothetical protein Pres01_20720 [Pseudomonas resinovorans]
MTSVKSSAKAFVSEGALSEIVVKIMDDSVVEFLVGLGFVAVPGKEKETLSLIAPNQEFKVEVFSRLRDEGICFSVGPDWCPAEVFEFLRDQKKLTGFYRKIVWEGTSTPKIIENC